MGNIKTYSIPIKNFTVEKDSNNSQFLKAKYYAISEGLNANSSDFELSGIQECLKTEDYAHKPILGAWNNNKITEEGMGGFDGHNSDVAIDLYNGEAYDTYLGENSERPLGLILPNTGKIEMYKGKQWLTFEGYIWTKYNREVVNFLKRKRTNNVSVEITVLESEDIGGIEVIKKFSLLGITIIGLEAGIPNACLNILEFAKTSNYDKFIRAFSAEVNITHQPIEIFAKDMGEGKALEIDLTKDSASEDNWGDISKTDLRNNLLNAKNYRSIIPKSYLVVEEEWEKSPSSKLKYPFVQIKSGKVVININGVKTASSFLMKEEDKAYFKTARAKLNKIRTILGMDKLFGIESDDDWGEIVSKHQPKIIRMEDKMNKKEIISRLSALFAEKSKLEKDRVDLLKAYDEKLGEFSFAEDDVKEELKLEVDSAKELVDKNEKNLFEISEEIKQKAFDLISLEEKEEEHKHEEIIEDEIVEYLEKLQAKCEEINAIYISSCKDYVVYAKEDGIFARKFEVVEDEVKLSEEEVKSDKVFVTIDTGGAISIDDTKEMPTVKVEVTNGIVSEIARANRVIVEKEKTIREKERVIKEMSADTEVYKTNVAEYIAKFDELIKEEDISNEYKESVRNKIYNMEFENIEDMEMKVQSHLYTIIKPKILSGLYTPIKHNGIDNKEHNEEVLIQELIKKTKKR